MPEGMKKHSSIPDDATEVISVYTWRNGKGTKKSGVHIDFSAIDSTNDVVSLIESIVDGFAHNAAINVPVKGKSSLDVKKHAKAGFLNELVLRAMAGNTISVDTYEETEHSKD